MNPNIKKPKITKFLHSLNFSVMQLLDNEKIILPALFSISAYNSVQVALSKGVEGAIALTSLGALGGLVGGFVLLLVGGATQSLLHATLRQAKQKGSAVLAPFDDFAHYTSNVLKLANTINREIHNIAPEDLHAYRRKVKAKFIVLFKDLLDFTEKDLTNSYKANEAVFNLLEKNTGIDFMFKPEGMFRNSWSNHALTLAELDEQDNAQYAKGRNRKKSDIYNLSDYIIEEVAAQKLDLLDLAYDVYLSEKAQLYIPHDDKKAGFITNGSIQGLVIEAILETNSTLNHEQTKEMVGVLDKMKFSARREAFLSIIVNCLKGKNQLDTQVLGEYIQANKELPADSVRSLLKKLKSVDPEFSKTKASPTKLETSSEHLYVKEEKNAQKQNSSDTSEAQKVVGQEAQAIQKQETWFPEELVRSLAPKALEDIFTNMDTNEHVEALRTNLDLVREHMVFLENHNGMLDIQNKIDIKVMLVKSLPSLLSFTQILKSGLMTGADYLDATKTLAGTSRVMLEHLEAKKEILKDGVMKDIKVIGQQFENRKTMSVGR